MREKPSYTATHNRSASLAKKDCGPAMSVDPAAP